MKEVVDRILAVSYTHLVFEIRKSLNINILRLVQGASYIYIYPCTLH